MHLFAGPRQSLLPQGHSLFGQCHAATVAALPSGERAAAFFAGEREGAGDTAIWFTRRQSGGWQMPRRLLWEPGLAHWNPVLHAEGGKLWLFYKVGTDVHHWTTRVAVSTDGGSNWAKPRALVAGDRTPRGPVKNKLLVLPDGTWLAPGSVEDDRHWDAFVDRSADMGKTWEKAPVPLTRERSDAAPGSEVWPGLAQGMLWSGDPARVFAWDGVIQPSLWASSARHVHMLLRSTRGRIYRSDSGDGGRTWLPAYATILPNNNSGLDLVDLDATTLVLACNPVAGNWARRTPLSLLTSNDNGDTWTRQVDLEDAEGEFSYPAIIRSGTNRLDVVYTANRRTIVHREIEVRR